MLNARTTECPRDDGQVLGQPVKGWSPRERPQPTLMAGRYCSLVPLEANAHANSLHEQFSAQVDGRDWTYLPYGPFDTAKAYDSWVRSLQGGKDPILFAIIAKGSGKPCGVAAYLRITPDSGSLEVGHLSYSPALQRTVEATEAMYLMMRRAFDELGYRRYEWKCDALNERSMRAARRLGFQYEGTFRQATVVKGRNRDTAWFAIVNGDWPRLRAAFEGYLAPGNFDSEGHQLQSLGSFARVGRIGY